MSVLSATFDASLAVARAAQLQLAIGLKTAEQQLLLMVQELAVLKVRAAALLPCQWGMYIATPACSPSMHPFFGGSM